MPFEQRCEPWYHKIYFFVFVLIAESVVVDFGFGLEDLVDGTLSFFELIGMFAVGL